jgi:hypothetical protein
MKILLVHPADLVEAGPWAETKWNLIVDLGWSGRHSYVQQAKRFGCRVASILDLLDHAQHRLRLRELLGVGMNQLVDSESIDWWEVYSAPLYQQVEQLMLSSVLAGQVPDDAEIFATRPHFVTRILSLLLKRPIRVFVPDQKEGFATKASRYFKKVSALRASQVAEIAFDKWDPAYRVRRLVKRRPLPSKTPVVLLPSAYVNVSRAQLAYARMLPERRFLLVVTRSSGRQLELPPNVELRSLASYAPALSPKMRREYASLMEKWHQLQNECLAAHPVFSVALELGIFAGFPNFLQSSLTVRDAWREVFATEPIRAVLSADEHNPFTRLPALLAQSRKVRTVSCHHGALNLTIGIRKACSDIYLASGDMERHYMTAWCGLDEEQMVVGGPQKASSQTSGQQDRDRIVFFSEQYELFLARTETFYGELLPELCSLARQSHRKVIVKLHPFESVRVRKAMIGRLPETDRALVEIRDGPMTPDLFDRAWFTVTVESSVAVESTMNGVPCFLCGWFDASWYEYARQYEKFSAGYWLESPMSVRQIPQLLEQIKITDATRGALHTSIRPERLEALLFGI